MLRVYIPLKEKKNPGATMWVAKVGHESNIAFYAVSDNMDELYESINEKAENYYSGLMELEKSFINVKKARLSHVDISETIINSATRKIEENDYDGLKIPPSILVPLELELVPVVNFDPEDVDPEFNRFVTPRNILSKEEIKFLNGLAPESKLTLVSNEDDLVWRYQKDEENVDYDALNGKGLIKELTKSKEWTR